MDENANAICQGPRPRHPNPNGTANHPTEEPSDQVGRPREALEVAADLASPSPGTVSDYPAPRAISDGRELVWDEDDLALDNYRALGRRLAAAG
ncbi:MAG TPA: hypothetical protein VFE78_34665, partial [Gemmataceae bacterium]|nr:hypothetical protein [Gemmataceae bacterium]